MEKIIVTAIAVGLTVIGMGYIVAPEFALGLTGQFQLDADARVDVQATYGGIQIGLGVALLILVRVQQLRAATIVLCSALGSVGIVRLAAALLSSGAGSMQQAAGVMEILLAGLLVFLVIRQSGSGK